MLETRAQRDLQILLKRAARVTYVGDVEVTRMFDVERLGPLSIVTMPRQLNVRHLRGLVACVQGELSDRADAIVLDLRDTDAIDMTALSGIVEMYKHTARRGVELRLRGPRESVRRLLAITRLDRIVRIDERLGAENELSVAAE